MENAGTAFTAAVPGAPAAPPLVVAVALTKGGTGKTTTAANVAGAAAVGAPGRPGVCALVVDADTQGQAAHALGIDRAARGGTGSGPGGLAGLVAGTATAAEALVVARPLRTLDGSDDPDFSEQYARAREAQATVSTSAPVYVLPGGAALAAEAAKMTADPAAGMLALRRAVAAAVAHLTAEGHAPALVVIDTPPGWGPLALGALAAADAVLCPVAPHPLAVEALAEFDRHLGTVQDARAAFGGERLPRLAFILPTMYDGRASMPAAVVAALRTWAEAHRDRPAVLDAVPYTVRVQEAPAYGALLSEHAPGHPAALAYASAAAAVLALSR